MLALKAFNKQAEAAVARILHPAIIIVLGVSEGEGGSYRYSGRLIMSYSAPGQLSSHLNNEDVGSARLPD